jgi:hypothetical protein
MGNVSTRPRNAATPVAAAVTAVTAPAPGENQIENTRTLFSGLADALREASLTDEPHSYSGDSDRLLRIAADIASTAVDEALHGEEAQFRAFDIAACVRAAQWVPADTCGQERAALLKRAGAILNILADTSDSLQLGGSAVTANTPLNASGFYGLELAQRCTWDIEPLCHQLMELSWKLPIDDGEPGLVRAAAVRISSLNSVLMSYLGNDIVPLEDAHRKVYGGLERLDLGDEA